MTKNFNDSLWQRASKHRVNPAVGVWVAPTHAVRVLVGSKEKFLRLVPVKRYKTHLSFRRQGMTVASLLVNCVFAHWTCPYGSVVEAIIRGICWSDIFMREGFKNHRLLPTGNHYDRMEGFEALTANGSSGRRAWQAYIFVRWLKGGMPTCWEDGFFFLSRCYTLFWGL